MKITITLATLFTCCMMACSNPAVKQSNTKLMSYHANDAAFKSELAKQLAANPNSFNYSLANYFVKNGQAYLNVTINRQNFNTTITVAVNNWDKIEGIKQTKGMGYSGAQLKGLKLAQSTLAGQQVFVYNGLDKIVD